MGDETNLEVYRLQASHALITCRRRTPDQPGSKIDEIRGPVHNNCSTRPSTLRVWKRSSSTEQNNLRLGYWFCLRLRDGMAGQNKQRCQSENTTFATMHVDRYAFQCRRESVYRVSIRSFWAYHGLPFNNPVREGLPTNRELSRRFPVKVDRSPEG